MKNRTVVKLLAKLGQRNINTLDAYLHSFYEKQECVLLFDAIKECAPKFSNKKMQVELVWKRCFPNKKLSINRLDKLCFGLQLHIKEFMSWQEMKEDTIAREKLFLKAANRYEMREEVEETLEGLVPLIKAEKQTEIWRNQELIEVFHHLYFSTNLMLKKDKGKQAFINLIENLDAFYLTYRTLLETEKRSREYAVIEEMQNFHFEEIRNFLSPKEHKNQTSPVFQTLKAFLEGNVLSGIEFYEVLEDKVFSLIPKLHNSDQEIILNFLTLVANHYAKKGKNEFTPKLFKILKYSAENKLPVKNNLISSVFFINSVDIACKAGEVEWAIKFYQDFQIYLKKEERLDLAKLSESRIALAQKDYQKAKNILEEKRFKSIHNHRSRWILTMVYYDSQDDKLKEECEAFTQYLYREKIYNEMNRRGTLNFLKVIDMLLDPNRTKNEIVAFIGSCSAISQRIWLDDKISERKF